MMPRHPISRIRATGIVPAPRTPHGAWLGVRLKQAIELRLQKEIP
jgi:hypothetical protein